MADRRAAGPKRRALAKAAGVRALERQVTRLAAARAADSLRHARQIAAVRRAADRRLAAMVQEIATLRHHEARAEALARLLGERDATIAALGERVSRLEALLPKSTPLAAR
jgi:hypothetical protein